jgi:hypothetical protein
LCRGEIRRHFARAALHEQTQQMPERFLARTLPLKRELIRAFQ